ncbi:MAG: hypothetical protein HC795_02935 [Coleofasciculaceae cyanobacterium RL_1_1]|nr:hypothetical protein [Coleofasciculaceae cyanobacterium RL_1_1]
MPPEPFSHFDHDDTPATNGSTLISSCTCPLARSVSGATYLPSARIHGNVLINLLTRQTWKAASIAQFAQQPIAPSPRSHHDKADLRQAAATYRADVAQDWQTYRLESQVRTAIWDVAQLLPTDTIEIVPHLASSQLSAEQCAAIAEMMHRPIVSHNEKALIAGIFAAWGELFRRRIVRVWSSAQLSCKTLTLSLELRSIPSVYTSGFAELHGDRLYVAATWGLPHIFDVGLIEPDHFDLDLASHSTQTQTLGQKLCSYTLQPSLTLSSGVELTLTEVSIEHQAQFALKLDDLLTLIKLAQSIRQWQHPALAAGMRIDWSFGSYCEPTAIAIQTEPEIDRNIDHTAGLENNSPPPKVGCDRAHQSSPRENHTHPTNSSQSVCA